jgi:probable rRNA maturation factor
MDIIFNYDIKNFRVANSGKIKEVIKKIISDNKKQTGSIGFVFTTDERILEINEEFLRHKYFTDIITFDYSSGKTISGEVYISIPTVKENARIYGKTQKCEIQRVIFHGILHLCGFDDQTEEERSKMRYMEDKYLVFLRV